MSTPAVARPAEPVSAPRKSSAASAGEAAERKLKDDESQKHDPSREPLMRPGTPDKGPDSFASPSSLSVSEGPSSSLEQDLLVHESIVDAACLAHRVFDDNGEALSNRQQRAGDADKEPQQIEPGDRCNAPRLQDERNSGATSTGRGTGKTTETGYMVAQNCDSLQKEDTRPTLPLNPRLSGDKSGPQPSAVAFGYFRNTSAVSLAESEASNSTFIDKYGTVEEGDDAFKQSTAIDGGAAAGSRRQSHESGTEPSNTDDRRFGPLAPPPSVFSSGSLPSNSEPEPEHLQCNTCKVVATSEEQLALHLEGKKHKRHLAMAELERAEGGASEGEAPTDMKADLHCNLCDVTAPSVHHQKYHLRGQKHQRREKQHQLLEASAELASSSVNALLTDEEEEEGEYECQGDPSLPVQLSTEIGASDKPLRSPFEAFDPSKPLPPAFIPSHLNHRLSSKMVRFSGNLESFTEEPEGESPTYASPPLDSAISSSSYKLVSGGSFSAPAAHFCRVCGIIATSEANLEDHVRGRRHARRLQYLSHLPAQDQTEHIQRMASGIHLSERVGSLVLPTSMDLRSYMEEVVRARPPERAASQQLNKSLSSQQLSWDSTNGLHLHMEPESPAEGPAEVTPKGNGSDVGSESSEAAPEEEKAPKPQPRCEICGITTTSQAHMEAHMAGRKHRRRVEAASGRTTIKQSPHYCALCDISTTSAAHLALHLVGRSHRRRQKAIEDGEFPYPLPQASTAASPQAGTDASSEPAEMHRRSGDVGLTDEQQFSCDLSGTVASSAEDSQMHRQSISHRRQERERSGPAGEPPRPPMPFQHETVSSYSGDQRSWGSPSAQPRGHPTGLMPQHQVHPSQMMRGPPAYPMGMYPYAAPPFYPTGLVPQLIPQVQGAPMYSWWSAPPPPQQLPPHGFHHKGPFHGTYQQGPLPLVPPPFPAPLNPYAVPMHRGSQSAGGGYIRPMPMPHQQRPPQPAPRGRPSMDPSGSQAWGQQQGMYNCEVCNVQTDQLDDLKQHLRGKQHMRRLQSPSDRKE